MSKLGHTTIILFSVTLSILGCGGSENGTSMAIPTNGGSGTGTGTTGGLTPEGSGTSSGSAGLDSSSDASTDPSQASPAPTAVAAAAPASSSPFSLRAIAFASKGKGVNVYHNATWSDSGLNALGNNDWVQYSNVNFGDGESQFNIHAFVAKVASTKKANSSIQIYLDSSDSAPASGTLIGALQLSPTGVDKKGNPIYSDQSVQLSSVPTGVHNLYLVVSAPKGVANIGSIESISFQ